MIEFNCPYDSRHCNTKELHYYIEAERQLTLARKTRSKEIFFIGDGVAIASAEHAKKCPLDDYERANCIRYQFFCYKNEKDGKQ